MDANKNCVSKKNRMIKVIDITNESEEYIQEQQKSSQRISDRNFKKNSVTFGLLKNGKNIDALMQQQYNNLHNDNNANNDNEKVVHIRDLINKRSSVNSSNSKSISQNVNNKKQREVITKDKTPNAKKSIKKNRSRSISSNHVFSKNNNKNRSLSITPPRASTKKINSQHNFVDEKTKAGFRKHSNNRKLSRSLSKKLHGGSRATKSNKGLDITMNMSSDIDLQEMSIKNPFYFHQNNLVQNNNHNKKRKSRDISNHEHKPNQRKRSHSHHRIDNRSYRLQQNSLNKNCENLQNLPKRMSSKKRTQYESLTERHTTKHVANKLNIESAKKPKVPNHQHQKDKLGDDKFDISNNPYRNHFQNGRKMFYDASTDNSKSFSRKITDNNNISSKLFGGMERQSKNSKENIFKKNIEEFVIDKKTDQLFDRITQNQKDLGNKETSADVVEKNDKQLIFDEKSSKVDNEKSQNNLNKSNQNSKSKSNKSRTLHKKISKGSCHRCPYCDSKPEFSSPNKKLSNTNQNNTGNSFTSQNKSRENSKSKEKKSRELLKKIAGTYRRCEYCDNNDKTNTNTRNHSPDVSNNKSLNKKNENIASNSFRTNKNLIKKKKHSEIHNIENDRKKSRRPSKQNSKVFLLAQRIAEDIVQKQKQVDYKNTSSLFVKKTNGRTPRTRSSDLPSHQYKTLIGPNKSSRERPINHTKNSMKFRNGYHSSHSPIIQRLNKKSMVRSLLKRPGKPATTDSLNNTYRKVDYEIKSASKNNQADISRNSSGQNRHSSGIIGRSFVNHETPVHYNEAFSHHNYNLSCNNDYANFDPSEGYLKKITGIRDELIILSDKYQHHLLNNK